MNLASGLSLKYYGLIVFKLRTVQKTSLSVHPLVLRHWPDLEADEPRPGPGLGHQPQPLHSPVPRHGDLYCAATAGLGQVRDVPQVGEVIRKNDLVVEASILILRLLKPSIIRRMEKQKLREVFKKRKGEKFHTWGGDKIRNFSHQKKKYNLNNIRLLS